MRNSQRVSSLTVQFALALAFVAFGLLTLPCLQSIAHADEIEVDAELVLAVDVSRSMSISELEIQRRGYAEALSSNEVISAITSGLIGRVAILYVEWAGEASQRVIVDWTLVDGEAAAQAFAAKLTARFDSSMRRTSISGVLAYGADQLDRNDYTSNHRIIDVSGDGPNNNGLPVEMVRDEVLTRNIVINGLPLMTREGAGSQYHIEDLDEYYLQCVIGGPGSFVLPVLTWDQFPTAVRQKLVMELAGHIRPTEAEARVIKVNDGGLSGATDEGYDCLIGEKIWQQRQWMWQDP